MAKVISVSNQKGGVGKTTTANGLAMGLRHRGFKVLCVDFDPQGNLSFSMRADNRIPLQSSVYHVLKGELRAAQTIQRTPIMDIIPCNMLLSGMEMEFTGPGREYILRDALKPVLPLYDYVVIDTPPALGFLSVNAFTASDAILVPVLSDLFSLQGIVQLSDTVRIIQERSNPGLRYAGVLLTKFAPREQVSALIRETALDVTGQLGIPLLDTAIRASNVMTKVQILREDMMAYAPKNNAVRDYLQLIGELQQKGVL